MNPHYHAYSQGYGSNKCVPLEKTALVAGLVGASAALIKASAAAALALPIAVGASMGAGASALTSPSDWDDKETRKQMEHAEIKRTRDALRERLTELEYERAQRAGGTHGRSLYLG